MKKEFQLCGLGNAIVDIFLELSDAEFANLGFETPAVGASYRFSPSGAAWTFVDAGVTGNASPFTAGNPPALEGVQDAPLVGGGVPEALDQLAVPVDVGAGVEESVQVIHAATLSRSP